MKPKTALLIGLIALAAASAAASEKIPLSAFEMKSSALVGRAGEVIAAPGFDAAGWRKAEAPTTVLSALVENGVYPDPYVGTNNMRIPDAHPEYSREHGLARFSHLPDKANPWAEPYWFRAAFPTPEYSEGQRLLLNLDGINYRAEVWLNGEKLAGPKEVAGMFQRFRFDVTERLQPDEPNVLAILIFGWDEPSLPAPPQTEALGPFYRNNGPRKEGGKWVSMQCSLGWDWMPAIRDRNMGIWRPIWLESTGPARLSDPQVSAELSPGLDEARLTLRAELENLLPRPASGTLEVILRPKNFEGAVVKLEQAVTLEPRENRSLTLSADEHPALAFQDPRLWWPNGLGAPNLYEVELRLKTEGAVSSAVTESFGIREVSSRMTDVDGFARRDFFINGKPVQLQGGCWVPDMMLNRSAEKFRHEVRLHRDANMNIIRVWGGGATPPPTFFEACDEMGMLVWQDFWVTGGANNPQWGVGSFDWPIETELFLDCARDTIRELRNHPSLIIWCGGNEGYPRRELHAGMRAAVRDLDGTRPYLPASGFGDPPREWGWVWPDNGPSGTYSGSPYHWVTGKFMYDAVEAGGRKVFHNEGGLPAVPAMNSLKKFIPDLAPDPDVPFPLNDTWGYHDACEGNGQFSVYHFAVGNRYGDPTDVGDYALKAQLLNANGFRNMYEAVNHRIDRTAGYITWKSAPAWPSVVWQLYDWYLRPHAGYYYAKRVCRPVNVQLDQNDLDVTVVNKGLADLKDLHVRADIYDSKMERVKTLQADAVLPSDTSVAVMNLREAVKELEPAYFVDLQLSNRVGNTVADNFYWMLPLTSVSRLRELPDLSRKETFSYDPQQSYGETLRKLPPVDDLDVTVKKRISETDTTFQVSIANPSPHLAFFLNASLLDEVGGREILPTFWSDNYVHLLAGESIALTQRSRNQKVYDFPHGRGYRLQGALRRLG